LHKTVLYSGKKPLLSRMADCIKGKCKKEGKSNKKSIGAKTQPYSVSRVNISISNLFFAAWSVLLLVFLWKSIKPSMPLLIYCLESIKFCCESVVPDLFCKGWFILLVALVAAVFWCNRKLRSNFDDMNPKKDVRWVKQVLPEAIRKRPEEKEQ